MIIEERTYLEHHGVKGQKWGIRNDRPGGVSRTVNNHAKKDAKEFAAAKAFYGEGAGTRRKLIKATVEGKSKRMPGYQKAFDHHLSNQDSSKHAEKAVSKRKSIDRKDKTKKRAGYLARKFTGEQGTQAAFAASIVAGAAYLNSAHGRATLSKVSAKVAKTASDHKTKQGVKWLGDYLKNQGL